MRLTSPIIFVFSGLVLLSACSLALADQDAFPVSGPPLSEPVVPTTADKAHDFVTRTVRETAGRVDSFFDDPNYQAEDAASRLRFRNEIFVSQRDDPKFKARINLKLHLPRLSRKAKDNVSLIVGGEDSLDDEENPSSSLDEALNDATNKPVVGLQYFLLDRNKWNVSLTSGVKVSGPALFVGPRIRYTNKLNDKALFRLVQRTRWFTDDGWDLRLRLDYDHVLSEQYFFRQTLDIRWRESDRDKDGFRTLLRSGITQVLSGKIAVRYQWTTRFKTKPRQRIDATALSAQYRRRFWRKWLFYEVVPQLDFQNDHDWKPNPGIIFQLEVIFGKSSKKQK